MADPNQRFDATGAWSAASRHLQSSGPRKKSTASSVTPKRLILIAIAAYLAVALITSAMSHHQLTLNPVRIVSDIDCKGGSGNGPNYVGGPVWVGANDPNGLDRDGDGWGCE